MSDDDIIPALPMPRNLTPEEDERLTDDLAGKIHKPETIAARYGFLDVPHLKLYLNDHPWIAETAHRRRALLESDKGTTERVVLKSSIAVEETIPHIAGIIMNPTAAPKDRIDAFKELRQAGSVGASKEKVIGTGAQFSLTINMPGGKQEQIVTTVVDQELSATEDNE